MSSFKNLSFFLIGENRYCGMCKIHIYTWFLLIINEKWLLLVQPLWVKCKWKIWLQYLSFFSPENVWLWYILRTFFLLLHIPFPMTKMYFSSTKFNEFLQGALKSCALTICKWDKIFVRVLNFLPHANIPLE